MTQRYIAHLIKLTFLTPDIIVAIKHGDIPETLSLGSLKKAFHWTGMSSVNSLVSKPNPSKTELAKWLLEKKQDVSAYIYRKARESGVNPPFHIC